VISLASSIRFPRLPSIDIPFWMADESASSATMATGGGFFLGMSIQGEEGLANKP